MKLKLKPVRDQTIVLTGASSGIGLATAKLAAKRGARVVLSSRDEADLTTAVDEIRRDGGTAIYAVADVADYEQMQELGVTAAREFGGIDTWVNNAGVSIYGLIEEVSLDDARRLFDTNYWGVVHGSLVALRHFRQRGNGDCGALINIGSVLSETGYPLQGHYAATKHAVKGFTDTLRIEIEKEEVPVSVTLIEPAAIDTPYPQHAKNYLGVEPKHEGPVYKTEIVADAILECCEHPHRTLQVGGSAKMFTMTEKLAPRIGDRQKMRSFEAQMTTERARDDDTLFAPRPGDGRVKGDYPGKVKQRSAYTTMAKHPKIAMLGFAALGVGLGLAIRSMSSDRVDVDVDD